ncbi:hypothetical protein LguiB_004167 [Lonicera macranthoides]
MVRPYAMKGQKRKKEEVKYDREETEQFVEQDLTGAPKRAKAESTTADEAKTEEVLNELAGIPIPPLDQDNKPGVIFILEKASLEVAKVGKAMLMILDSQLNKAGRLRALYVRTEKGVLFEIKPYVRIPRTYKQFSVAGTECSILRPGTNTIISEQLSYKVGVVSKSFLKALVEKLRCLRSLALSGSKFEELQSSIGDLKHLRTVKSLTCQRVKPNAVYKPFDQPSKGVSQSWRAFPTDFN